MNPFQLLLRQSIDYAGLFPPAGLDMAATVSNYAQYRISADAWALGRLIVPAGRLSELEQAMRDIDSPDAGAWLISALAGPNLASELQQIALFNAHQAEGHARALVDSIELKADSVPGIEEVLGVIPNSLRTYVEIPIDRDPAHLIDTICRLSGRAKVRTGGVTADAFPTTAHLIRFIYACVHAQLPFKATAGLHHPVRAEYRLTYAPDSPLGTMYGFLNLFLAAALARAGAAESDVRDVLEERASRAFQIDWQEIRWRGYSIGTNTIRDTRDHTLISFGSCSFTEPLTELKALHLLESRVHQA
jgi:hypothetical protein